MHTSDSADHFDFANQLPQEIFMEIFYRCCCFERHHLLASMAMRLSQVCASWRTLAISMPTLWASFSIELTQVGVAQQNEIEIMSRLLHLHLERSAKCPLSFDVDFDKPSTFIAASDLVAALVEHSERWSTVKMPFLGALASIYARLSGRLDRLESLDLRIHGMPDQNQGADSPYFEVAPRLGRLALGASLSREMRFPSNQLTVLHLGAAPTMEVFHFMTLCPCPNLTTLILNPYYPLKLPVISQTLPALLHLRTLILAIRDGYSRNPVIDVLDLLTAPSLQNFEIIGVREIQLPRQAFASFLERSGCTLRVLTITFKDNLPFLPLQHNLLTLSSLTHFTVFARGKQGDNIVNRILQSLTLPDAITGRLLPNLLTFELQAARFHSAVVDLVASRLVDGPDCSRLENLVLHNAPTTPARERLQAFREQGLAVSILPRYMPARSAFFI
ncbi:hypothetical protein B0H12DRAFT_674234 [Mycena haematopus]|nr:hypothetical protein B0H12DRAFT_674234 [Mycena haematopus]